MQMIGYLEGIGTFTMDKKEVLFFFSTSYPYGIGEQFVETELIQAARYYKKVFLFPLIEKRDKRQIHINGLNILEPIKLSFVKKIMILFLNLRLALRIYLYELKNVANRFFFIANSIKWFSKISESLVLSNYIKDTIDLNGLTISNIRFYSFWMKEWALTLAIMKEKKIINEFVFRCNGIDIYDERRPGNYMPFKRTIYKNAKIGIPNSKTSAEYLTKKNIQPEKVHPFYLGTFDHGTNPYTQNLPYVLASCSRISPEKRLQLIPQILQKTKLPIKWIHIGGSNVEVAKLHTLTKNLPENISIEFTGCLKDYKEILNIYNTQCINLFINVSETEGLPVAIQEAISFGIPALGTDVGGIREVVTSETGILINKDFEPQQVASLIEAFLLSENNSIEFRIGVKNYWKKTFNSNKIYPEFLKLISA